MATEATCAARGGFTLEFLLRGRQSRPPTALDVRVAGRGTKIVIRDSFLFWSFFVQVDPWLTGIFSGIFYDQAFFLPIFENAKTSTPIVFSPCSLASPARAQPCVESWVLGVLSSKGFASMTRRFSFWRARRRAHDTC